MAVVTTLRTRPVLGGTRDQDIPVTRLHKGLFRTSRLQNILGPTRVVLHGGCDTWQGVR